MILLIGVPWNEADSSCESKLSDHIISSIGIVILLNIRLWGSKLWLLSRAFWRLSGWVLICIWITIRIMNHGRLMTVSSVMRGGRILLLREIRMSFLSYWYLILHVESQRIIFNLYRLLILLRISWTHWLRIYWGYFPIIANFDNLLVWACIWSLDWMLILSEV